MPKAETPATISPDKARHRRQARHRRSKLRQARPGSANLSHEKVSGNVVPIGAGIIAGPEPTPRHPSKADRSSPSIPDQRFGGNGVGPDKAVLRVLLMPLLKAQLRNDHPKTR